MKTYLVGLSCGAEGRQSIETMVVQMEDDYNPMTDVSMDARVAPFMRLKMECLKQIPSGFHKAHHLLRDHMEYVKVISLSRIDNDYIHAVGMTSEILQREKELYWYYRMQLKLIVDDDDPISEDTRRECLSAYTQHSLLGTISELVRIGDITGVKSPALTSIESKLSKIRWIKRYFMDHPRIDELNAYIAKRLEEEDR